METFIQLHVNIGTNATEYLTQMRHEAIDLMTNAQPDILKKYSTGHSRGLF